MVTTEKQLLRHQEKALFSEPSHLSSAANVQNNFPLFQTKTAKEPEKAPDGPRRQVSVKPQGTTSTGKPIQTSFSR